MTRHSFHTNNQLHAITEYVVTHCHCIVTILQPKYSVTATDFNSSNKTYHPVHKAPGNKHQMLFFSILLFATCAYSETYNKENATKLFEYYKTKYNKNYKSEAASQRGLHNFINNLNKVSTLNDKSTDNATLYIVSMYADQDSGEIRERYAISLKTYTNAKDPHNPNLLGHDTGKFIEDTFLYDLTKADHLYKSFMAEYNKTIAKRERVRTSRYYRFIKTLVEINRNNFAGHDKMIVDENADVVKAPHDFFL